MVRGDMPRSSLFRPGHGRRELAAQQAGLHRRHHPRQGLADGADHRVRDVGLPVPLLPRFALETFPTLETGVHLDRQGPLGLRQLSAHQHSRQRGGGGAAPRSAPREQDAFWPVHDLLYQYQDTWAPLKEPGPFFLSLADSAGISKPKLLECVKSPATESEIRYEAEGRRAGGREQHADLLHRGRAC